MHWVGKPPLAQDGFAMVSLTRESAQLMSAISPQPETEALHSGGESTRLLRNRNRNVMKHIPKGTLIALSKKTGSLRPIVIGFVWRRLAALCADWGSSSYRSRSALGHQQKERRQTTQQEIS